MLQLKNTSPFKAAITVSPNEKGIDTLYTVIKGTFAIGPKVEIAEEQAPIIMADEYWGKPGQSSLKYASEMHLIKPSTDIVMNGDACVPGKRPVTKLAVILTVANTKKTVLVFGDRHWEPSTLGFKKSPPLVFDSMPMVYERAFGGRHVIDASKEEIVYEPLNPVGLGFKGKKSKKEIKGMPLPNIENPKHLLNQPADQPKPTCFGYVAPSWEPRKALAGTYDEVWQKKRAPFLPDDFNPRFFNSAGSGLIMATYLQGGEPVKIVNMSADGPLQFNIPQCHFKVDVDINGKTEQPALNIETLLLEPNQKRFSMVWRAAVQCDKQVMKIKEIRIDLQQLQMA